MKTITLLCLLSIILVGCNNAETIIEIKSSLPKHNYIVNEDLELNTSIISNKDITISYVGKLVNYKLLDENNQLIYDSGKYETLRRIESILEANKEFDAIKFEFSIDKPGQYIIRPYALITLEPSGEDIRLEGDDLRVSVIE